MAESINAFKSKYTGEQLEELFDKLKELAPPIDTTKAFSTLYPYTCSGCYENDNIKITAKGSNSNGATSVDVLSMVLTRGSGPSIYKNKTSPAYLLYEFKNNILVRPTTFHTKASGGTFTFDFSYLIDGSYQKVVSADAGTYNSETGEYIFELPDIETTAVKITSPKINASSYYVGMVSPYLEFKLVDTDAITKNSNANPTVQNNFNNVE